MSFDANTFMQSVTTEALDTRIIPTPVGEYVGIITKVDGAGGTSDKGNKWAKIELTVTVEGDSRIKEVCGMDKKSIRGSVMLDLNENDGIAIGPGKNVQLGRLRAAVGQNQPGAAWGPTMLMGQPIKISVAQRPDKDGKVDDKGQTITYDDVKAFLPANG